MFLLCLFFHGKNRSDQLMRGASPGSIYAVYPSGWIQLNLFTGWFKHFIQFAKPTEEFPVLLVLDGHSSHTRNLDVIKLARENHVYIVSLPPHSTHKLQPLDKIFVGPLKAYYSEEIRTWLRINNSAVTHFDLAELLGNALLKCQTTELAVNGFRVTEICPLNKMFSGMLISLPSKLKPKNHVDQPQELNCKNHDLRNQVIQKT